MSNQEQCSCEARIADLLMQLEQKEAARAQLATALEAGSRPADLPNPLNDLAAIDVLYRGDVVDGLVEFQKVSRIIKNYMRSADRYYKSRIGHYCEQALAASACEKDAARYRWLCDNNFDRTGETQVHTWLHNWEPHSLTAEPTEWKQRLRGSALDRAIDAAMQDGARIHQSDWGRHDAQPVVVGYRMEMKPGDYSFMDAKHWQYNKHMYTGSRVHEVVLGRLVHEPDCDEEVLRVFPSIVEEWLGPTDLPAFEAHCGTPKAREA